MVTLREKISETRSDIFSYRISFSNKSMLNILENEAP